LRVEDAGGVAESLPLPPELSGVSNVLDRTFMVVVVIGVRITLGGLLGSRRIPFAALIQLAAVVIVPSPNVVIVHAVLVHIVLFGQRCPGVPDWRWLELGLAAVRPLPRRRARASCSRSAALDRLESLRVRRLATSSLLLHPGGDAGARDTDRGALVPSLPHSLVAAPQHWPRTARAHGAQVGPLAASASEPAWCRSRRRRPRAARAAPSLPAVPRSFALKAPRRAGVAREKCARRAGPVSWASPGGRAVVARSRSGPSAAPAFVLFAPLATLFPPVATAPRSAAAAACREITDRLLQLRDARRHRRRPCIITAAALARHAWTAGCGGRALGGVMCPEGLRRGRHPQQDAGGRPLPALATMPGGLRVPLALRGCGAREAAHGDAPPRRGARRAS
jgi:hypothetical protein